MKKIIFILITTFSFLQADMYLLTMSKDDKVCQKVLKILNHDMIQYNELRLQTHEEFNSIKWDEDINLYIYPTRGFTKNKKYYRSKGGGYIAKMAMFDINNDGQEESILFERTAISHYLQDRIRYYPMRFEKQFKEGHFSKEIRNNELSKVGAELYNLKSYPIQREKSYISIPAGMKIRPFKLEKTYYIGLFGQTIGGRYTLEEKNMISISKFDKANTLTDVCYIIKTYQPKKIQNIQMIMFTKK